MAARVGSVVVDLVANTAQFEAGMKQAAVTTAATDKMITQKAWQTAQSTDKMAGAMDRFQRRSMGAMSTMEGTTAAMMAHQFGAGGLTRVLFQMDTAYARVKMRADDAARAMVASGVAMNGANSSAMILTRTFAAMAGKIALVVGAIWLIQKAAGALSGSFKQLDIGEGLAKAEANARALWDSQVGAVDRLQKTINEFRESTESLVEAQERQSGFWNRLRWQGRFSLVADLEADLQKKVSEAIATERREGLLKQAQDASEAARRIADELRQRSVAAGFDPATGDALTDAEQRRLGILRHFETINARVNEISHDHLQNRLREIVAAQKAVELARLEAAERVALAEAEQQAHAERMGQIREQAQAMSAMFGRAADLATGWGADVWRAVQESTRAQRVDQAERYMLDQSGAGGDASEKTLQDIRKYLRDLLSEFQRLEAQSI